MDDDDFDESKKTLKQTFRDLLSANSVMNELAIDLYYHAFLGAKFKEIVIASGVSDMDLRINLTWLQNSRSGKGRVNKVFKKICDACDIKCDIITSYSVAGIIGTINEEAVKHNDKYASEGLCQSNPVIIVKDKNGNDKKVFWHDPVIRGDAGNYDILIFDEMKILLEPTNENQDIMLNLQPALDYPPHIRKKLRHAYPVEYSNPVTLIGTTYPFDSIAKILGTEGYIQRTVMLVRNLNIYQINQMRLAQEALFEKNLQEQFNDKLKIFKDMLIRINATPRRLYLTPDARLELRKIREWFSKHIENSAGGTREMLLSFTNTIEEATMKIAGQYVVVIGVYNEIGATEIKKSWMLLCPVIESLIENVRVRDTKEETTERDKVLKTFENACKKQHKDKLNLTESTEVARVVIGLSRVDRENLIKKLATDGFLKMEKGEKKEYLYSIKK